MRPLVMPAVLAASASLAAAAGAPARAQPISLLPPAVAPPARLPSVPEYEVPPAPLQAQPRAGTVIIVPPSAPTVTYALLPGHWALDGARWLWVPPETVPRRVVPADLVQGRYVWRGGRYVWVPTHYDYP